MCLSPALFQTLSGIASTWRLFCRKPHNQSSRTFYLGSSERAICASPSYLQRCGVPMVPSDLMSHECLSGRFSELAETWNVSREGDWEGLNISPRLLSDNGDLLRQSCVLGAGLGN